MYLIETKFIDGFNSPYRTVTGRVRSPCISISTVIRIFCSPTLSVVFTKSTLTTENIKINISCFKVKRRFTRNRTQNDFYVHIEHFNLTKKWKNSSSSYQVNVDNQEMSD